MSDEKQMELMPVEELPHQYREIPLFMVGESASSAAIDFTENIRRLGVLQNVMLLDRAGPDDKYTIITGNKKVAAARAAGKTTVPAMIFPNAMSSAQLSAIVLSENLHRKPSPALEAEALQELINEGYSQKGISRQLGLSRAAIQQRLSLLNLEPRLFAALRTGELKFSVARDLAKLPPDIQAEMADAEELPTAKVVAGRLRRHKLEQLDTLPFPDWANDPPATGTTEYMDTDGKWHPVPADRASYCYAHKDYSPETGVIIQLQLPPTGTDPANLGIAIAEAATAAMAKETPIPSPQGRSNKSWEELSDRAKQWRRQQARRLEGTRA